MKHLLISALAFAVVATASAQTAETTEAPKKWDGRTAILLKKLEASRAVRANAVPDSTTFIIRCTSAEEVAEELGEMGCTQVSVITPTTLTAELPHTMIEKAAALDAVKFINAPRQKFLRLNDARTVTKANSVHSGTSLSTPYTGKGVVVGVIDQGFQYKHLAFKNSDGSSRVISLYDLLNGATSATTTISDTWDKGEGAGGHATHVTGIAAGSKIGNIPYYGMAPEADIIMVPSSLGDDEILKGAKHIKTTAEGRGEPWVINMSFGSQMGPHDGTTEYDQTLEALCGEGGIMCGAMGNEGSDQCHLMKTIATKGDAVYVAMMSDDANDYNYGYLDVWSTATDGKYHFSVTPYIYANNKLQTVSSTIAKQLTSNDINEYNKKQHYEIWADFDELDSYFTGLSGTHGIVLKIKAMNDDVSFHAWTEPAYGSISTAGSYGYIGDSEYTCNTNTPSIIAVGSYVNKATFDSYEGDTYSFPDETTKGKMSSFSSRGPSLGTAVKPNVCAPGGAIVSAINRYDDTTDNGYLDKTDPQVIAAYDDNGKRLTYSKASSSKSTNHFYYIMSGTSMATPAVTGIVALWLQANPKLTPSDVQTIIRETSDHDAYTQEDETGWNKVSGYGKINAYNGLKKALEMGASDGIGQTISNSQPFTLSHETQVLRVLFNTPDAWAEYAVYSLSGSLIAKQHISQPAQGSEVIVPLEGLAKGVYIVRLSTPNAAESVKVQVGK